jgi:hypothetical protein
MQIVHLFDEVAIMVELQKNTVDLIHATSLIDAIKKLTVAYDIIELNLMIEKKFSDETEPPWDIPALSDLSRIRRELMVYHRPEFDPTVLLDKYSGNMIKLFNYIQVRKNLSDHVLV